MGKGPEPVPIRIISRIYGKDLEQDGWVMGTLRFAHPTGLLPGEWRFLPNRGVRGGGWAADRTSLCETPVA